MTKRNGKPRHVNRLVRSDVDTVSLARAVEERFLRLCGSWLRIRGEELIPPPDLDSDMLRWRKMVVRYRKGDFRHTEAELESTKTVAQWTVTKNCELRNQPQKTIQWPG